MGGKVKTREIARRLRAQGKSLNEIVGRLHVSKSSASIWVRDVRLTLLQKQKLKEKELRCGLKGLKKVHKKWQEYHLLHPKINKGPRWPQRSVENFFDTWTPEMAYVLGYFAADGCMYRNNRGSYYIGFTSTDPELIETVKEIMEVTNRIEEYQSPKENHQRRYALQIGSKKIFQRLLELGFTPRKSLTLKFPNIPNNVLGDFVRGHFDGDGCAFFGTYKLKDRRKPKNTLLASFTSGSRAFLVALQRRLVEQLGMGKGCLRVRHEGAYNLGYSLKDARQLYNFMYPTGTVPHLRRKKVKFEKAFSIMGP